MQGYKIQSQPRMAQLGGIGSPVMPAMPGFSGFAQAGGAPHPSVGPPVHAFGPPEPAIRHVYDHRSGKWIKQDITVALHDKPFQQGTLRVIYHMKDLTAPAHQQAVVGKVSKDPNEPSTTYFMDVEMQGKAKAFAELFNSKQPPKRIDFVLPYVVEFKNRMATNGRGRLLMGVEGFMHGKYEKHSNNYGFVHPDDRNTPAAFSHFSYHASNGKMLVCDIQGVGDMYTDPQIHSGDRPHRWGKADMGPQGIQKFFETHRCNAICEFFQLPVYGKKKPVGLGSALSGAAALAKQERQAQVAQQVQVQQAYDISTTGNILSPGVLRVANGDAAWGNVGNVQIVEAPSAAVAGRKMSIPISLPVQAMQAAEFTSLTGSSPPDQMLQNASGLATTSTPQRVVGTTSVPQHTKVIVVRQS